MLELVLEQPWWVGIIGTVSALVAAQWWLSSGRREAIQLASGAILLTVSLVVAGIWIETEQESLRNMLYRTADDLQNNRKSEILSVIYESPSMDVLEAKQLLSDDDCVFEIASIKKIHSMEISGPKSARRGLVKMNVFVEGHFAGYAARVPRFVELTLYRVDGRWLVYDFRHDQPFAGFQEP